MQKHLVNPQSDPHPARTKTAKITRASTQPHKQALCQIDIERKINRNVALEPRRGTDFTIKTLRENDNRLEPLLFAILDILSIPAGFMPFALTIRQNRLPQSDGSWGRCASFVDSVANLTTDLAI